MTPFDSELGRLDSVEFILSSVLRNSRWAPESYGTHSIAVTAFEKFGSGPAHSTAAGITKLTVSDSISGDLIQQQYSEDLECMVTGGVGICRDHTLNDTAYNGNNILLDHLTEYENPYDVILNQTLDLSLLILAVGVNGDGEASIRSPWLGTLDVVYTYAAVPVPATIWLFGSASLALFGMARRKK